MNIGPDTLILTNVGVKNITELYRDYKSEKELPDLLTYDTHFKILKYKQMLKIEQIEDVELYTAKFYDTFMSKMSAMVCSRDTQILRYDICNTKLEPIVGGSYNVYSYLKNNWKLADPDWQPISELLNHGAIAPNLASGDLVVKFVEKKVLTNDFAYKIYTGKKEIKIKRKTSEPNIEDIYEEAAVFASQSFHFNYNFIFIK